MPVIAITGGVATGKTILCSLLKPYFGESTTVWFSADSEARRLIKEDSDVRRRLLDLFGGKVFDESGGFDRAWIRRVVFADCDVRRQLESVLHPLIRRRWLGLAEQARKKRLWMFAEIPLLYETKGDECCDRVVVTACSTQIQRNRMIEQRGLSEALVDQIRMAQMSLTEKCSLSDHLIWNDSSLSCLGRQAELLAHWLRKRFS